MKAGGPLGLSIVGGVDHSSHPFGADEPGVFVSKVRMYLYFVLNMIETYSLFVLQSAACILTKSDFLQTVS